MNKVVSINLNGRAFQLEENGYNALRVYLEQAGDRLKKNPDRDEILADFEQAIAEKCDQHVKGKKTVVTDKEIEAIIAQMGPVGSGDSSSEPEDKEAPSHQAGSVKRFYLISEGKMLAGVATGIASYFNVDVTVVRVAIVLLTLLSHGFFLGAYIIAAIIAPDADTPEKRAAARGDKFNSEELLEAARKKYADISDKTRKKMAEGGAPAFNQVGAGIRNFLRAIAGIVALGSFAALLGLVAIAAAAVSSMIFSGQFLGVALDPTVSTWLFVLFVTSGFLVGATPVMLIAVMAYRYARSATFKQSMMPVIAMLTVFAIAVGLFVAIPSASPSVRTTITQHDWHNHDHANDHCFGYCE